MVKNPQTYADRATRLLDSDGAFVLEKAEVYAVLALVSAVDRIADALNQNARVGQDMSQHVLGALAALNRAETE